MKQFEGCFNNPFEIPQADSLPEPKLAQPKRDESQKIALIIDTNVLLKQTHLKDMLRIPDEETFKKHFEVITLEQVIKEVKDEQARRYIEHGLPFEMTIKNADTAISKQDMNHVQNFAKDTGDFKSLSKVDQLVIALGVNVARQKGEYDLIKKEPLPLKEFKPKAFVKDFEAQDALDGGDWSSEEEQQTPAVADDDEWNDVQEDRQTKRTAKRNEEKAKHYEKIKQEKARRRQNKQPDSDWVVPKEVEEPKELAEPQKPAETEDPKSDDKPVEAEEKKQDDDSEIDDEEEGGEWVTAENLYKHISNGTAVDLINKDPNETKTEGGEDEEQNESEAIDTKSGVNLDFIKEGSPQHVVFLTSDFAMQNVIIQLGFTLLTLDGYRLTRVKRFKLLCRGCQHLNMNVEREYCDKCGAHALAKVSVYINEDGEVTYFDNPKRRINLRGTRYDIKKYTFGRNNKDMILREDQLMIGWKAQRVKDLERAKMKEEQQIKNTLQGNYWAGGQGYTAGVSSLLYDNGAKGGANRKHQTDFKYGHGRKNPNIARKKV